MHVGCGLCAVGCGGLCAVGCGLWAVLPIHPLHGRYLEGVIRAAHRTPPLIHLLSLQEYLPYTDLAELIASASPQLLAASSSSGSGSGSGGSGRAALVAGALVTKVDAWTQTNPKHVRYDAPDPNYDWNEWNLRRKAIQLVCG